MENFKKAQDRVLRTVDAVGVDGRFEAEVEVPKDAPLNVLVVRALASEGVNRAVGVMRVKIEKKAEPAR